MHDYDISISDFTPDLKRTGNWYNRSLDADVTETSKVSSEDGIPATGIHFYVNLDINQYKGDKIFDHFSSSLLLSILLSCISLKYFRYLTSSQVIL